MKTRTSRMGLFWNFGAVCLVALGATAQTTDSSEPAAPPSNPTPAKLPYGVEDVLKLSRAQVSEDVTLNYIHNSGTIYSLGPKDIVYLRDEGVSDKVINAMIDQRQNVPADIANQNALQAQAAAAAGAQAPVGPDPNALQAAPVYVQPPPLCAQSAVAYVSPDTAPPAPSSVYVLPYAAPSYGYVSYPSYYYGGGYAYGTTVYVVGNGYSGHRYYTSGHSGAYHRSTVYHMGRH